MSTAEEELLLLLTSEIDDKLKVPALEFVLGLTATDDGIAFFMKDVKFLKMLTSLLSLDNNTLLILVLKCFVNLTSDAAVIAKLLDEELTVIPRLLEIATCKEENSLISTAIMVLSNVTRNERASEAMLRSLHDCGLEKLVHLLCKGTPHWLYHYIASIMANLTQVANGRRLLLSGKEPLLKYLLPFTTYADSEVRRFGIVGAIKNCCFDPEHHELLLDENLNLLSSLLLPLAGSEELDEGEMDKLPLDLQYLEDDKQRDSNPKVRKMLIEALTQLCAKKEGRQLLRDKNVYVILRELHKWETVAEVTFACENLVDILIGDEPQEGMENLREIDIPPEMIKKFEEMDKELLKMS